MNTSWMARYLATGRLNSRNQVISYIVPLTHSQIERERERLQSKWGYRYLRDVKLHRMGEGSKL